VRPVKLFAVFAFILFATTLLCSSIVPAQQNSNSNAEKVKSEIINLAKRHFETGSALKTEFVVKLYRNNSANLSDRQIADIYEQNYLIYKKQENSLNLQKLITDPRAMLSVLIIFVFGIFVTTLKKHLTKLIESLWNKIYAHFAGSTVFRLVALKRYRKAIRERFELVHIPFRPQRPLDMADIYIPLKVSGLEFREEADALEAVAENKGLIVKGPPGSGKSMLLKQFALSFSMIGKSRTANSVLPVFLELHRLNETDISIQEQLEKAFERFNFPNARKFINRGLERNSFLLLLDGLDEVSDENRPTVVQALRDFLTTYSDCRYVITCRTAVYSGEFDDITSQSLDVVEFSDQQIWRFLRAWEKEENNSAKTVNQLIGSLRDRPSIMVLARNPLMLTIIAHLFTDIEDFVLPQSRAEFYKQSSDILLQRWQEKLNKFPMPKKRIVLQKLAIELQDSATDKKQDRRSIKYLDAVNIVKSVGGDININDEDAETILNEIVERSGILVLIDNGARFQFAHLTLQEFFAAEALHDDIKGLFARFERDRPGWREVVKLWCGKAGDSSELIESIFDIDPLTGFECLADAQMLRPVLADRIISSFLDELGASKNQEQKIHAFATVASSKEGRGKVVFDYLVKTVKKKNANKKLRSGAILALAMTNLPDAAKVLADLYAKNDQVGAELYRMGDLGVPGLLAEATRGNPSAAGYLARIATPLSIENSVPLLWHEDENIGTQVAWHLTELIGQPEIEQTMQGLNMKSEHHASTDYLWVWKPFANAKNDSMYPIVSRIAELIANGPVDAIPEELTTLDSRIVLPLCGSEDAWSPQFPLSLNFQNASAKSRKEIVTEFTKTRKTSSLIYFDPEEFDEDGSLSTNSAFKYLEYNDGREDDPKSNRVASLITDELISLRPSNRVHALLTNSSDTMARQILSHFYEEKFPTTHASWEEVLIASNKKGIASEWNTVSYSLILLISVTGSVYFFNDYLPAEFSIWDFSHWVSLYKFVSVPYAIFAYELLFLFLICLLISITLSIVDDDKWMILSGLIALMPICTPVVLDLVWEDTINRKKHRNKGGSIFLTLLFLIFIPIFPMAALFTAEGFFQYIPYSYSITGMIFLVTASYLIPIIIAYRTYKISNPYLTFQFELKRFQN